LGLFDQQLDVGPMALVGQDLESFRPTRAWRISVGWSRTKVLLAFWLTLKLEAPSLFLGDLGEGDSRQNPKTLIVGDLACASNLISL